MISDLIVNISLLMSFTFIWHQLFRNNRLSLKAPLKIKVLDGLIGGSLGILLIYFGTQINEITILDLRHIPVLLVAFYGGAVPAFIAAAIISTGRFFIDVNYSSVISLFMMFAIAGGASLIVHYVKVSRWTKWLVLLLFSQFMFSTAFFVVVDQFQPVINLAIYHVISTFVGGMLIFYFVSYIRRYSEMYMKYKHNAQRDALTGLYNVRSFDYFYNSMIGRAKKIKDNCAVCLIDVDYFKKINDTYGHLAGDEVLRQLASLLSRMIREEDILSRNGGEEFSILLNSCSLEQANEIASRIRKAVEKYHFHLPDKQTIQVTVSIGVAIYDGKDVDCHFDLYQEADDALYKAKKSGRNNVCLNPIIQS